MGQREWGFSGSSRRQHVCNLSSIFLTDWFSRDFMPTLLYWLWSIFTTSRVDVPHGLPTRAHPALISCMNALSVSTKTGVESASIALLRWSSAIIGAWGCLGVGTRA